MLNRIRFPLVGPPVIGTGTNLMPSEFTNGFLFRRRLGRRIICGKDWRNEMNDSHSKQAMNGFHGEVERRL